MFRIEEEDQEKDVKNRQVSEIIVSARRRGVTI